MILIGTLEASRTNRIRRRLPNGTEVWRSELITVDGGAQAFLVEQDPHSVVQPHFHLEDEFQVIVAGDGALGRHVVHPIAVHYANRHTGYGPITAGTSGISYMTLRARLDLGAHWLPDSRQRLENLPRRNLHGKPAAPAADALLRSRTQPALYPVIPMEPDGVAAWGLQAPPGQPVIPPPPVGKRFYVVVAGAMQLRGERLAPGTVVFATPDDHNFAGAVGDAGLELLILQFAVNSGEDR